MADLVPAPHRGQPTGRRNDHTAIVGCDLFRDGVAAEDVPTDLVELYGQARDTDGAFVWLGLHEPTAAQLTHVAEVFGLHPLAIEDIAHREQRIKLERYDDVVFLVMRAARYVEHERLTVSSKIVNTGFVRLFVGPHFVITVRQGTVGELRSVRTDPSARPEMLAQGPWAVVHAIMDRIVDVYADIATAMQTDVDAAEAAVFAPGPSVSVEQMYQLKRELMEFKAAVLPLQRPLATLLEKRAVALPREIRRYLRDVADHHAHAVEQVTAFDDLLNSILQARLAQLTIEQNDGIRKIAAWAAIAALQTAIAGVYGMNFKYMPELQWRYSYPVLLLLMLVSAVALHRRLRRAGWL